MAHQESQPVTPVSGGPRKASAPFVANSAPGALTDRYICICPDLQCQTLIRRVFKETDPDHVWRKGGGFTVIKFRDQSKPSEKVESLRRAVVLHLQLDSETANFKIFYVCNTHDWPVAMLEAEGNLSGSLLRKVRRMSLMTLSLSLSLYRFKLGAPNETQDLSLSTRKAQRTAIVSSRFNFNRLLLYLSASTSTGIPERTVLKSEQQRISFGELSIC